MGLFFCHREQYQVFQGQLRKGASSEELPAPFLLQTRPVSSHCLHFVSTSSCILASYCCSACTHLQGCPGSSLATFLGLRLSATCPGEFRRAFSSISLQQIILLATCSGIFFPWHKLKGRLNFFLIVCDFSDLSSIAVLNPELI